MAVTVQMQFESVVTEIYQDAFVGSSIENGTTRRCVIARSAIACHGRIRASITTVPPDRTVADTMVWEAATVNGRWKRHRDSRAMA